MKTFRTVLFWLHLVAGSVAGVVVLIMSVTGVLLMYEKQMIAWADTHTYNAGPPPSSGGAAGAARLPIETLIAKVREARPDVTPATVTLHADPAAPAAFAMGRDGNLYVNAYTGAMLGGGSQEMRGFFRSVTEWHRYLAMQGENRPFGKSITGASNLLFLFLVASGFYLWFPKIWNARQFRNVMWFRRGLPGKARDFNWHNVIGFWSAVPLFIVVLSGVVISYPWAGNLVYRAVGEEPPAPQRPPGGGPGGPGGGPGERATGAGARAEGPRGEGQRAEGPRGEGRRAEGQRGEGPRGEGRGEATASPEMVLAGLNAAWTRAEQQTQGWRSITLRLPASGNSPAVFTIDGGYAGQPQKRGTLTLDRRTADVARWETYENLSRGRQLRTWLRFAHTGEIYGLVGQTIAGVVSLGGAFLVYTGLALALRRFFACRKRRAERPVPDAALAPERESPAA